MAECACGCGKRADQRHHVVYAQTVRAESVRHPARSLRSLLNDPRNDLPVAFRCHEVHHRGGRYRLELPLLRDENFEFAAELFRSRPKAYEYLRRKYRGTDPRLDALLEPAVV